MNLTPTSARAMKRSLLGASNPDILNMRFKSAMRSLDFTAYAVGYLPDLVLQDKDRPVAPAPFLLLNWPVAWLELYARQGFAADDIVVAEAARTVDPFTWLQVQEKHPGASAHIFAAAADFGWIDGFVIPVHNVRAAPGERFGIASLASNARADLSASQRQIISSIVITAFARAVAFRSRKGDEKWDSETLSPREQASLMLVAEGLDDAAIGDALGVTKATAHFHVERAKKRLNAKTRAQAVAIALMQGLL